MTEGYTNAVAFVIKRFLIALLLFGGMIGLSVTMMDNIPKAFLPVGRSRLFAWCCDYA